LDLLREKSMVLSLYAGRTQRYCGCRFCPIEGWTLHLLGNTIAVKWVIRRRLRKQAGGVQVEGDVDAVLAVNRGQAQGRSAARSAGNIRIVQRGRTPAGDSRAPAGDVDKEEL
jgi:hypothetical protein